MNYDELQQMFPNVTFGYDPKLLELTKEDIKGDDHFENLILYRDDPNKPRSLNISVALKDGTEGDINYYVIKEDDGNLDFHSEHDRFEEAVKSFAMFLPTFFNDLKKYCNVV
jgi:hypothetical protein